MGDEMRVKTREGDGTRGEEREVRGGEKGEWGMNIQRQSFRSPETARKPSSMRRTPCRRPRVLARSSCSTS